MGQPNIIVTLGLIKSIFRIIALSTTHRPLKVLQISYNGFIKIYFKKNILASHLDLTLITISELQVILCQRLTFLNQFKPNILVCEIKPNYFKEQRSSSSFLLT